MLLKDFTEKKLRGHAKGRRIRQTTHDLSSGDVVTEDLKMLYDGWRCVAELNATNNALVRSYVWGLDLSGTLDGAGGVGGLLMLNSAANGVHFYAYDGNGNVAGLVKASDGTVSQTCEYDPFGRIIRNTGLMAGENRFLFSTKRCDRTTDLELYEYRVRNPDLAWLSRDPMEERGGFNLYDFAYNNPEAWVDPFGRRVYLEVSPTGMIRTGADWLRIYHCSIVIEYCDHERGGMVRETFEISGHPNIAPQPGEQRGITRRTRALGIVIGSVGSGSAGSSSGGSTSGSSGGFTSGPIGSSGGTSSGSSAGGSSGSSSGSSAGSSASSSAASVLPGPTRSPGEPNARRRTHVYIVDGTYAHDQDYVRAAQSMPLGMYDLFSNNCCHWAASVVSAAGGSWPISMGINAGINQGNPNAENTEIPNPQQLPTPGPQTPATPTP